MPVPVPRLTKPVAHPVIKNKSTNDVHVNSFHNLTCTLPVSPTGPPPAFGTREQWINSLPTWRRTKPRRIWEDDVRSADHREEQVFTSGLTFADNAQVIKGKHAEARIPPILTLIESTDYVHPSDNQMPFDGDADDEMSSDCSQFDQYAQTQWSNSSGEDGRMAVDDKFIPMASPTLPVATADGKVYQRGAFTPIFEDESPESAQDVGSSPLEPVTPFGDFIDKAVAAQHSQGFEFPRLVDPAQGVPCPKEQCGPQCYQPSFQPFADPPKVEVVAPPVPDVVTPSATNSYRKLTEPLANWVANYVWKVCTTGLSLPSTFARPSSVIGRHLVSPPNFLAPSVHSLLLSTLLQPSAVILAIWYIVRLPVYIDAADLGLEYVKEIRFRGAIYGGVQAVEEKDSLEASAPFRLIVLGCMLANKWLDDHTFSNKTWHTISHIPIETLNKLESLALDIFSYDLSISPRDWSQWLSHIMSYHLSLASPVHPQPISRPSTNPHSIVKRAIEEIIQAPAACNFDPSHPQPVFLGLEERRREKAEKERALANDVLEIDLDEDGPLREEYLPKRRVSSASSSHLVGNHDPTLFGLGFEAQWSHHNTAELKKPLPPPAKWSPAGDEPIMRENTRNNGHYVAVQPPLHPIGHFNGLYHPHNIAYSQNTWFGGASCFTVKPQGKISMDTAHLHPVQHQIFTPYTFLPPIALSHSRSQSLSYEQENIAPVSHTRSYSQAQYEYRCSDIRMTANELAPPCEAEPTWGAATNEHFAYGAYGPLPSMNYQSAWLRT